MLFQMKHFNGNIFEKTSYDKSKTHWVSGSWFMRSFHGILAKSLICATHTRLTEIQSQGSCDQDPPTNWAV